MDEAVYDVSYLKEFSASDWKEWRDRLPQKVVKDTPQKFQKTLDRSAELLGKIEEVPVQKNRMAVVLACYDSAKRLPKTLEETADQMRQNHLGGEIFIILNNGGGDTREYLIGDDQGERKAKLKEQLGVDVVYGHTQPRKSEMTPQDSAPIELDEELDKDFDGIRLIVIDQQEHPDNAGKVRALRDIYPFLHKQSAEADYRPKYLLTQDDETRLRRVDLDNSEIMTDENLGLDHMIDMASNGANMVGAKLAFVPFNKQGDPDWEARVPPMQKTVSFLHGKRGFEWMPGGATISDYAKGVSMQRAMSEQYIGARVEDCMMTTIARSLGERTVVDSEVVHTNRCPSEDDEQSGYSQMNRWMNGMKGLENAAGKSLVKTVLDVKTAGVVLMPALDAVRRGGSFLPKDVPHLLKGLPPFLRIQKGATKTADDFLSGKATW